MMTSLAVSKLLGYFVLKTLKIKAKKRVPNEDSDVKCSVNGMKMGRVDPVKISGVPS